MNNRTDDSANTQHQGLSLADLVIEVWRGKWIIMLTTFLALVAAFVYLAFATPIYQAQLLAIPVGEDANSSGLGSFVSQIGGIAGLPGSLSGDNGIGLKNEALATLESRSFVTNFLKSRKLLPLLYEDLWDAKQNQWLLEDDQKPPTYSRAHRLFVREIMAVREDRDSGVISVYVSWHDREVLADWANGIVESLNDRLRTRSLEESRRKIDYLQKELERTSVAGIQQGIYRLLEAELSQMAVANTRVEYAFKIIDPAVTPDSDDTIKPRRLLALASALFLGLLTGLILVAMRLSFRSGS